MGYVVNDRVQTIKELLVWRLWIPDDSIRCSCPDTLIYQQSTDGVYRFYEVNSLREFRGRWDAFNSCATLTGTNAYRFENYSPNKYFDTSTSFVNDIEEGTHECPVIKLPIDSQGTIRHTEATCNEFKLLLIEWDAIPGDHLWFRYWETDTIIQVVP